MRFRIIVSIIVFSVQSFGGVCHANPKNQSMHSFFQQVGQTDWDMSLKGFEVSTKKDGKVFRLQVKDNLYLGFSAYNGKKIDSNRIKPLQEKYAAELSGLLTQALCFAGQDKNQNFSMGMTWEMYPESIQKWAQTWQDSFLRKKWDMMDRHARYKKLVTLISEFLKNQMQNVVSGMGFEIIGASMEKMSYQKAQQFAFYNEILAPVGIPKNFKIPIPMMLSLFLQPLENEYSDKLSPITRVGPYFVDYLFAVANQDKTSIYCSFQRGLDEYEITGDIVRDDGTRSKILPMSQKKYHPICSRLINACLSSTGGDKRKILSFRMNLEPYPDVYREVVRQFTHMPKEFLPLMVQRSKLSHLTFYAYSPTKDTGFRNTIKPFWDLNEYEFLNFQISISSGRTAKKYPYYESLIKPMGIGPNDKPSVPDIVYMIVKKKECPQE